jgi:hypothetical protein
MTTFAGHLTEPPKNGSGRPIPNALITLKVPGTENSPIFYQDAYKDGVVAASQIKTDSRGNIDHWVEPGTYEYWYDGEFLQEITVDEWVLEDDVAIAEAIAGVTADFYNKAAIDTMLAAISVSGLVHGSGPPTAGIGTEGSYYIDDLNKRLYGPKSTGWPPSYTNLVGEPGEQGPPGISDTEFVGVWDFDEAYLFNQQVAYEGLLWTSLEANTGQQPDINPDSWVPATMAGPPGASGHLPLSQQLANWTASEAYQILQPTYHGTYPQLIASATVLWPDNSAGTYTMTDVDASWAATKSYVMVHSASGGTITQPALTRDGLGRLLGPIPPLVVDVGEFAPGAYQTEYTGGY